MKLHRVTNLLGERRRVIDFKGNVVTLRKGQFTYVSRPNDYIHNEAFRVTVKNEQPLNEKRIKTKKTKRKIEVND